MELEKNRNINVTKVVVSEEVDLLEKIRKEYIDKAIIESVWDWFTYTNGTNMKSICMVNILGILGEKSK